MGTCYAAGYVGDRGHDGLQGLKQCLAYGGRFSNAFVHVLPLLDLTFGTCVDEFPAAWGLEPGCPGLSLTSSEILGSLY